MQDRQKRHISDGGALYAEPAVGIADVTMRRSNEILSGQHDRNQLSKCEQRWWPFVGDSSAWVHVAAVGLSAWEKRMCRVISFGEDPVVVEAQMLKGGLSNR